jgi:CDP-diacylglycerol---serine O-phosphatidyltransferase
MTAPLRPPLRRPLRRPNMRRAVILFPSGFTLGNLFFGIFAIIAASRLEFTAAGVYVMLGGICDALDGRVARATNSGTEFGEELDSLVDAISFGLAPAMIMYFAVLNRDGWDWVWVFTFAAAAVLRLARFNIEQAGTAKTYFQGLPSPAAGITLASYYWFSQSSLYEYGAIADLKWHVLLRYLMAMLSFLMISNVPYPSFPRMGFRSFRGIGASLVMIGGVTLLLTKRLEYFFPLALGYIAWGLLRWVFFGLFERRQPTMPYDLSEGEDDEDDDDDETFQISDSRVHASKQGHREDVAARHERMRARAGRSETETAAPRAERPPRRPERPERTERPERPERTAATTERPADAERARRDKKKERNKGTDRAERAERPERPERAERAERPERSERLPRPPRPEPAPPVTAAPTPIFTGVDAITLGEPATDSALGDDEELLPGEDDAEMENGADGGAESGAAALAGAPARKRKRRRRRGERKERGATDPASGGGTDIASAGAPPESIVPTAGDEGAARSEPERSPYAAAPNVTPAPPLPVAAPTPASPPPLPPSSSSSVEPSE